VRTRVVVVDDDDISRRGFGEILADHGDIDVVGMFSHDDALRWTGSWSTVDVVIVDAADERRTDDHFAGVAVVERVRQMSSDRAPVVIVVTGHFFDDAVRRRMREADADFFYHRSELQDTVALCAAVLRPDAARVGVPDVRDAEALFRLGITASSRVNDGVRAGRDLAITRTDGGPRSRPRSRLRPIFNRSARLNPVNRDGTIPDREQQAPSFPQIERFLEWATRTKRDPPTW
jgi:DNA-binding NtrC family response regulator